MQVAEKASAVSTEVLAIKVRDQAFGIDVMSVREIRGWTNPTPLPHAPRFVSGVINLRGVVLPIIDLAARLGFSATEPTLRHAIVVVELSDQVVGILVDGVSDIISLDPSDTQATPEIGSDSSKAFIRGVVPRDNSMIELLALDALVPSSRSK
jgi:purine-binding chemotaxis protein CheW